MSEAVPSIPGLSEACARALPPAELMTALGEWYLATYPEVGRSFVRIALEVTEEGVLLCTQLEIGRLARADCGGFGPL